jgi:hypothetical protein
MVNSRIVPSPERFAYPTNQELPSREGRFADGRFIEPLPLVRRRLSPEGGRALEILGHAIEYLADEYAVDVEKSGVLGTADPRIEAIQVLKTLNRTVYFTGVEAQPVFSRLRRWFLRLRTT